MNDHPFNEIIKRIDKEWRDISISIRALGPDPVAFSWDIIRAWEEYKKENER